MKRLLIAVMILALAPMAASAALIVSAPDLTVSNSTGGGSFDILLDITEQNYDVGGYALKLSLSGPAGVSFDGAVAPSSNYVFAGTTQGLYFYEDDSDTLFCDNFRLPVGAVETLAVGSSFKLLTVNYMIAAGATGVWDLNLVAISDVTGIINDGTAYYPTQWQAGSITVTPEPASLALLGLGGLVLLRRRGKRG